MWPFFASISLGISTHLPDTGAIYTLRRHPDSPAVALDSAWLRRLEPYESARSTGFAGWAPRGMLIARREGDFTQLFHVKSPGAKPVRVSDFSDRVDRMNAHPDPGRKLLLITRDSAGNEQYRPFLYRWDSRRETPWPAPPGRVSGIVWSRDGSRFAYAHTPQGSAQWDIRVGSLSGSDRPVLRRPGAWIPLDFSADGKFLLVLNEISASESRLWKLSLRDTSRVRVLPDDPPQAFGDAFFLAPERGKPVLAFVSDRDGEYRRLFRWRWGDSSPEVLSPPADGDVEWLVPGPGRRFAIYSLNLGKDRLFRLDLARPSPPESLAGIPEGLILPGTFRPGTEALGATAVNPETPGDALAFGAGAPKLWARADPGAAPKGAVRVREIRYPAFDPAGGARREIRAFIYRAAGDAARRPALIQIHGGPELQARPGYDPFLRFCVLELGLAVIQPNVRGSTGYGKSFQRLDDGLRRLDAVRDVGALLDWIAAQPDLDSSRVAVMGRSYGGFMALSSLALFGDRLRVGVSGVGIAHFPSFLEGTSGYRRDLRRVEYGDERDPAMRAFLDSISPLNLARKIRSPVLLSHGRGDPRVPLEQSERMFAALAKNSPEAWLLILEGEGHGLKLKSREALQHAAMAQFLARHLLP